jgi:hypothetical protein
MDYLTLSKEELKVPAEPHLVYLLRAIKDRLLSGSIDNIWWIDTRDMISDVLTKGGLNRRPILKLWAESCHYLQGDTAKRLHTQK